MSQLHCGIFFAVCYSVNNYVTKEDVNSRSCKVSVFTAGGPMY